MIDDFERCYRLIESRDARFDGQFIVGVASTGVYCRPSCPARSPARRNVRLFATAAAAQSAGFRACKRCEPDAAPGSPEWNKRADVAGRAFRLIGDGVVDREGVPGLAARLSFSERHLNRILSSELGAGPVALARARRAQTARMLIESTDLPFIEVSAAAGFGSVRQFNDTVRATYDRTPSQMRARKSPGPSAKVPGAIELRLPTRSPFDGAGAIEFLGVRAMPGVEERDGAMFRRVLVLAHGTAVAELEPDESAVRCRLRLDDLRDLSEAVTRCRRLLDLDADPQAVAAQLAHDRALAPLARAHSGLRIPGAADGFELAVRAVLGQQVSVAAARTVAGRIAQRFGEPLDAPLGGLTTAFPTAARLAAVRPGEFGIPQARARAIVELAGAVADGDLRLDAGADAAATKQALLAVKGVGPWTADYIAMRALGDPDIFLGGDLGVRHGLAAIGLTSEPAEAAAHAARWRPWRSYASVLLWRAT